VKSLKASKDLRIRLLPTTRLEWINWPLIECCLAVWQAYQEQDAKPVMTGADYESYPAGTTHDRGLAWDWRIWDVKNPAKCAERIAELLTAISPRWRILYGDKGHLDHIHVAYMGAL